jgi:hypothetical protein
MAKMTPLASVAIVGAGDEDNLGGLGLFASLAATGAVMGL